VEATKYRARMRWARPLAARQPEAQQAQTKQLEPSLRAKKPVACFGAVQPEARQAEAAVLQPHPVSAGSL
jgi:hypothetical protein